LDALRDAKLAKTLITIFTDLETWLEDVGQGMEDSGADTTVLIMYVSMLFALKQLLSLRHRIPLTPSGSTRREDFMRSWKRTALSLGLN
jgi:hypothetical protein